MPIKPENRHRYPDDWPEIRERILQRAGHRCEHLGCGARQYAVGCWHRPGGGEWKWLGHWGQNDNPRTYREARQVAAEESFSRFGDGPVHAGEQPIIVIVLTIAHLDHQPENCAEGNLRALCQRHHLAHDHLHHQVNAAATRRAGRAISDLFPEQLQGPCPDLRLAIGNGGLAAQEPALAVLEVGGDPDPHVV